MEQVLVCLKSNGIVNIDVLDDRRKELVALGKTILSGNKHSIEEPPKITNNKFLSD